MNRWRAIFTAIHADVQRNPTWYALVGYITVAIIRDTIRATIAERQRVRDMLADLERDMTERLPEIAERMTYARQGEHDAKYDRVAWNEIEARPASKDADA